MPPREPALSTPIIVVGRREAAAGLLADGAVEVLTLPSEAVEPPDRLPAPAPAVTGMARQGDRLILVLDPRRLCEGLAHPPLPG
jgi:chemotaxis signal transduction protein